MTAPQIDIEKLNIGDRLLIGFSSSAEGDIKVTVERVNISLSKDGSGAKWEMAGTKQFTNPGTTGELCLHEGPDGQFRLGHSISAHEMPANRTRIDSLSGIFRVTSTVAEQNVENHVDVYECPAEPGILYAEERVIENGVAGPTSFSKALPVARVAIL